jgi:3-oxoacyl-[acyl-carrier-protein] synthase III
MQSTAKKLKLPMDKAGGDRGPARQHLGGFDAAGAGPRGARRSDPAGETLLLEGVGGGFTWGAVLLDF